MRILRIFTIILTLFLCTGELPVLGQYATLEEMMKAPDSMVFVAAHRGDWKNHPENSLSAIQSCIDKGIDIVEIDVRMTKDKHFVLMHDASINRTTNGRGKVKDMSLHSLQQYLLKGPDGKLSAEHIPSLEEVLDMAKGKILLNLDKSSIIMEEILPVIDSMGARQIVILKGNRNATFFSTKIRENPAGPLYMPILNYMTPGELDTFLTASSAQLVEFILANDTSHMSRESGLALFKKHQCRIWYNALYKGIASGYGENKNAKMTWDHFLERDAFIIQTDYPFELMQYLIDRGVRAAPEGWENVSLNKLPDQVIDTAAMRQSPSGHEATTQKGAVYHTIKSGDTLYGLALSYHTTVKAICAMNANLTEKTVLQIGRKIRIR